MPLFDLSSTGRMLLCTKVSLSAASIILALCVYVCVFMCVCQPAVGKMSCVAQSLTECQLSATAHSVTAPDRDNHQSNTQSWKTAVNYVQTALVTLTSKSGFFSNISASLLKHYLFLPTTLMERCARAS